MFRWIRVLSFVAALSLGGRAAQAAFTNIPWSLNGSTFLNVPGRVVLTTATLAQNGSVWNPCKINLTGDFDLFFAMNWGDRPCGADGITFVLQPDSVNQLGSNAGAHAYDGCDHSIAVQFDTFSNLVAPYSDPVYDSIGLQENGNIDSIVPSNCGGPAGVIGTCGRPQISATNLTIKDGIDHAVEIKWVASSRTLSVTVDGSLRANWTFSLAAFNAIFTTGTTVWYGFTASTGGFGNFQQIAQTSADPNACQFTPTAVVPAVTPLVLPTNDCGTPTNVPSFTFSPTQSLTPTISPTFTQTSTPYPPGCGVPVFESAANVGGGCLNGTPNTFSVTAPAVANTLMMVYLENGSGSSLATSITYNGATFTLFPPGSAMPGYTGSLCGYYLVALAPGTHNLVVNGISGCSWNVIYEFYSGVDQVSPVGGTAIGGVRVAPGGTSGASPYLATFNLATFGPASLVSDFAQTDQVVPPVGPGQVPIGVASNCCETIFADYKVVNGPGNYPMTYTYTQAGKRFAYYAIEVRGAANCNSPTPTMVVTATNTPTSSPTCTATGTPTLTLTPTATRTRTATRTATPIPLLLTPHHPNPDPAGGDLVYLPYTVTADSKVHIKVFDISGELIVDGGTVSVLAGNQEWAWDLANTARRRVSSGIYLCRIQADANGGQTQVVWEKCSVVH